MSWPGPNEVPCTLCQKPCGRAPVCRSFRRGTGCANRGMTCISFVHGMWQAPARRTNDSMRDPNERRCGTCRHYEPSTSWRRGWCRNTLLFAPGKSPLVQNDKLDCSRGSGVFGEPPAYVVDEPLDSAGQPDVKLPTFSPLKLFAP